MGNFIKSEEIEEDYYSFQETKKINITYNNKKYELTISKYLIKGKIYIKIKEKTITNKLIHIYYEQFFEISNFKNINSYFNKENTLDNSYKNILYLIKNNRIKILFQNSYLIIIFYNLSQEREIITTINLESRYQTLDDIKFNDNPNFNKNNIISKNINMKDSSDILEVYFCYKDDTIYIVSPSLNNFVLNIYSFQEKNIILKKQLIGHKNIVSSIRYFLNKNNLNEYLISSDYDKIVIIWDITNNYNILVKIDTKYDENIYSCLMLFNIYKNDLIITSTTDTSNNIINCTKVHLFKKRIYKSFDIIPSKYNHTMFLLYWFNRKTKHNYLIECCVGKICIYSLLTYTEYYQLQSDNQYEVYTCGFVFKKNNEDFLITTSDNDYIRIWNLHNKNMILDIKSLYCSFSYLIRWNDKYFIIADQENTSIKIVDIEQLKVINNIKIYDKYQGRYLIIKKIKHPFFGESLICFDKNNDIKIWYSKI